MKYIIPYIIAFCVFQNLAFAQTDTLFSRYDNNIELSEKEYFVKEDVTVSQNATLVVMAGAKLTFAPNTKIIIEGGLDIRGTAKEGVYLQNQDNLDPGNGFEISGFNPDKSIVISGARFFGLNQFVSFKKNWFRNNVLIINNVFKFSNSLYPSLEFLNVDQLLPEKSVQIKIINNVFSNNNNGIFIAQLTTPYSNFVIEENVITLNQFSGRDESGLFYTPLFTYYNESEADFVANIQKNAIFDNFNNSFYARTFESRRMNINVLGTKAGLDVNSNYFGLPDYKEAENTFDLVNLKYQSPKLFIENRPTEPLKDIHSYGFQYKVNDEYSDIDQFDFTELSPKSLTIFYNRPTAEAKNYQVKYFYLEGDTMYSEEVNHKLLWNDNHKELKVLFLGKIFKKNKNGYLFIDGLYGENFIETPAINLGKKSFFARNNFRYVANNSFYEVPLVELDAKSLDKNIEEKNQVLPDSVQFYDSLVDKSSKFWEIGLFVGSPIYFGDMSNTGVNLYIYNTRPCLGLRVNYHFSERFSLGFANNNLLLVGSDNVNSRVGKSRGTNFSRGLSVRTFVSDFSLNLQYKLMKFKTIQRIVPIVFAGVQYYYFNPQREIDGQWYNLRDVGTEGQTLNGEDNRYKSFSWGIPFGIGLQKHINQKWLIALSYTHVKLFTDYLDDLSTGTFPDKNAIIAANPDLGETAYLLSNPNGISGQRSYSGDNDAYAYWGFTITKKIY